MISVPGLKDTEQPIRLQDGTPFVGLYDPTKEVGVTEKTFGENVSTRYTFRFLATDGRLVSLQAGAKLFDEMVKVCGISDKARWLQITAIGKPDINRTYDVKEVPAPSK